MNFIDGIAPGGATMTSPSGTVNLVVGAPPHGSMHGKHFYEFVC